MKGYGILVFIIFSILFLSACGKNSNVEMENNRTGINEVSPMDVNYISKKINGKDVQNDQKLFVSEHIQHELKKIDEIEDAKVIISNHTAYVAIRISGIHNPANVNQNAGSRKNENPKHIMNVKTGNNQQLRIKRGEYNTGDFKRNVSVVVHKADPRVDKVYVTVESKLFSRMSAFEDIIQTNGSNESIWGDFHDMVKDYFHNDPNTMQRNK